MINLIPPQARKQVRIEYWVRVVSVWMLLLAVASFICALLLIPSLVLIQSQLKAFEGAYKTASDQNDAYKALEKEVRDANTIARQLVSIDVTPLFTQFITDIENTAAKKVVLRSIDGKRNEEGFVEEIKVSGVAPTRTSLVAFKEELTKLDAFESVHLPLSNLAKDKDASFNIVITISNNKIQ